MTGEARGAGNERVACLNDPVTPGMKYCEFKRNDILWSTFYLFVIGATLESCPANVR
jgi:hypothetical protein